MKKNALFILAACILLTGCSRDVTRNVGEWLIADRSDPSFRVNAVRPVFSCEKVTNPDYPCAGKGPEGFERDLVVKPIFNKRVVDMYSNIRKVGTRVKLTWFSMQGACGLGRVYNETLQSHIGIFPYYIEDKDGELKHIKRTGEAIRKRHSKSEAERKRFYLLGDCETGIDMSAGQPFRMQLYLWAPTKFGEDLTVPVVPSATSKFSTGCRTEKRNGITWQVCNTAGKAPHYNKRYITYSEQREEVWTARLGRAGFVLRITASYRDPLFRYPQWYAERQANLLDVIDTVTVETLPYPPVIPEQQQKEMPKNQQTP